jgi:hypothetical protein
VHELLRHVDSPKVSRCALVVDKFSRMDGQHPFARQNVRHPWAKFYRAKAPSFAFKIAGDNVRRLDAVPIQARLYLGPEIERVKGAIDNAVAKKLVNVLCTVNVDEDAKNKQGILDSRKRGAISGEAVSGEGFFD